MPLAMVGVQRGSPPCPLTLAAQSSFGGLDVPSRAMTYCPPSRPPMVRIFPLAKDCEAQPRPRPLCCHRSFGPSFGHDFRRPVSAEMPSRCAPRHWDQTPSDCFLFGGVVALMAKPAT